VISARLCYLPDNVSVAELPTQLLQALLIRTRGYLLVPLTRRYTRVASSAFSRHWSIHGAKYVQVEHGVLLFFALTHQISDFCHLWWAVKTPFFPIQHHDLLVQSMVQDLWIKNALHRPVLSKLPVIFRAAFSRSLETVSRKVRVQTEREAWTEAMKEAYDHAVVFFMQDYSPWRDLKLHEHVFMRALPMMEVVHAFRGQDWLDLGRVECVTPDHLVDAMDKQLVKVIGLGKPETLSLNVAKKVLGLETGSHVWSVQVAPEDARCAAVQKLPRELQALLKVNKKAPRSEKGKTRSSKRMLNQLDGSSNASAAGSVPKAKKRQAAKSQRTSAQDEVSLCFE
jgi:hypothetical protein